MRKKLGSSSPEDWESFFDELAPQYDEVQGRVKYTGINWVRSEVSSLALPDFPTVFDFGCATGVVGRELNEIMPTANLIGVDRSAQMLLLAEKKGIYSKLIQASLENRILPDILSIPADLIVCTSVTEYLNDLIAFCITCLRSLKYRGHLLISFRTKIVNQTTGEITRHFEAIDFLELLRTCGFKIISSKETTGFENGDDDHYFLFVRAQRIVR